MHLLVIDDEPAIGRAIARILRGTRVEVVTSGAAALELLRKGPAFDAVLCDLFMPGMNGVEIRTEIEREWPSLAGRVVLMTGSEGAPGVPDPSGAREHRWIHKPFDMDALQQLVDGLGSLDDE